MTPIEDIVNALEIKINKVLQKQEVLKQTNLKLQESLKASQQELQVEKQQFVVWKEKFDALKIANSMLGSDTNKRETKLKINTLIREIDYCIEQLSE